MRDTHEVVRIEGVSPVGGTLEAVWIEVATPVLRVRAAR